MSTTPDILDNVVFPAVSVREALLKCFEISWHNRRVVTTGRADEIFNVTFHFAFPVPMPVAQQVLAELEARSKDV